LSPTYAARWVLFAGFVVLLFNAGGRFAMSLTLVPMSVDLGWSRTTLSTTVTIFMAVSALSLPFAGRLVDRFGASPVLAVGIVLSGTSLALMSYIEAPLQAYLLYGIFFAIGSAMTSITSIGVMLNRWYPHRAGMANSIAISGMGVGQLLIVSALASQLALIGWRGSYALLGIAMVVVVLPLLLLCGRWSPPAPAPEQDSVAHDRARPQTLRMVVATRSFWALAGMYIICGFQDFLVATHIVAFALDSGVPTLVAGNVLAFMGLCGLIGVLGSGVLNDKFGANVPTALCFVIRIGLFACILFSQAPSVIIGAALAYGFTFWITAPLTVIYARVIGSVALLGTLTGLITMLHHVAGGLGALVGARVFDTTGTYHLAMVTMLVTSVIALALTPWFPATSKR
jgi:MFS family permease